MKLVRPVLLSAAALVAVVAVVFACGDKSSKTSATAAANGSMPACCAAKKTSATAASAGAACTPEMAAQCAASRGTKSASADACPGMHGASMAACAMHRNADATAAAAGATCSGHAMLGAMATAHGDCSACDDMAACDDQLIAAGARVQVVSLKNGVMYVYTTDSPDRVKAVQAAVALRNRRVADLLSAGDAKLCSNCRRIRGAMASGRMNREVVNVESGALTLVTSNNKAMVSEILDAANSTLAVRTGH